MKNIFKLLSAAILLVMVSCSEGVINETDGIVDVENGEFATLTLGAPMTKVAYVYDDVTSIISAEWETGDQVSLYSSSSSDVALCTFTLKSISASDLSATFVADDAGFSFEDAVTYQVVYSPAPEATMTQSASGDASHLKNGVTLSAEFTYGNASSIILKSEQCIEVVTISAFGGIVPTSISFSCDGETSTVNLGYTPSGEAVVLIPAKANSAGSVATFVVSYEGDSVSDTPTLSQNHEAGCIYYYSMKLSDEDYVVVSESTATSNDNTITLTFDSEITEIGEASDFSVSVSNDGSTVDGISVSSIAIDADNSNNLIITLSDKIYNDDDVKLSYGGSSVACLDGLLDNFVDREIEAVGTTIVQSDYHTMYSFDDGNGYNTQNTKVKGWELSTEQYYNGTTSAHFDGANLGITNSTAVAVAYYIGSSSNNGLSGISTGKSYVVRFMIYFDGVGLTIDGNSNPLMLRYKGTNSDSAEVKKEISFSFDTESATYQNSWQEAEQAITIGTSAEPSSDVTTGNISFRFTNTYTFPPSCKFYIDDVRIYDEETLYRP